MCVVRRVDADARYLRFLRFGSFPLVYQVLLCLVRCCLLRVVAGVCCCRPSITDYYSGTASVASFSLASSSPSSSILGPANTGHMITTIRRDPSCNNPSRTLPSQYIRGGFPPQSTLIERDVALRFDLPPLHGVWW